MRNFSSKFPYLLFCLVAALLLMSCAKSEETTNKSATPANTAAAPSPATTTTTASATDVGVPECDAFIKAYEACVKDKVPAQVRPTFESTVATWRKTWHDQAANPQVRASLVTACKSAQEQAKTTMKAYNCTF
jgi:hypothetical protein